MGTLRWDSGFPWTVPPVHWYSGIGQTVGYGVPQVGQWTPMDSPTCPMVQWDRTDSGIGRTVGYGVPQVGQWNPMDSPTCPMVQWDRKDSGIWGHQMGQWTHMDSPICPMVQWEWDMGPSDGTVDSHGQSQLSHGTVG